MKLQVFNNLVTRQKKTIILHFRIFYETYVPQFSFAVEINSSFSSDTRDILLGVRGKEGASGGVVAKVVDCLKEEE